MVKQDDVALTSLGRRMNFKSVLAVFVVFSFSVSAHGAESEGNVIPENASSASFGAIFPLNWPLAASRLTTHAMGARTFSWASRNGPVAPHVRGKHTGSTFRTVVPEQACRPDPLHRACEQGKKARLAFFFA